MPHHHYWDSALVQKVIWNNFKVGLNSSSLYKAQTTERLNYVLIHMLVMMIAAAMFFTFMLGALSFKYSVDVVVALPFMALWMVWFFHLAYQQNTIVKDPERIFEIKPFLFFSILTLLIFIYLYFSGNQLFG